MNLRYLALGVVAVAALGGTALADAPSPTAVVAQTVATPVPAPTPTTAPERHGLFGHRGGPRPSPTPEPTETPMPSEFTTLDGVWEVQMQPLTGARTIYSHLYMKQDGDNLSGTWVRNDGEKDTFTGSWDGRLFTLNVTQPAFKKQPAGSFTMKGYIENFMDIVGLLQRTDDTKDDGTPFTAAHRKKGVGPGTSIGPGVPGL